jgi:hypothetical protein
MLAGFAHAAADDRPSGNAVWYSIRTEDGKSIGYAYHDTVGGADGGSAITDYQEVRISEPAAKTILRPDAGTHLNRQSWRTVLTTDAHGAVTSIASEARNGNDWTRNAATIAGGMAMVTRASPDETRTLTAALPADVRFDGGDALLSAWGHSHAIEFDMFDIDSMTVEHVTITALPSAAGDAPGVTQALRRRYADGVLVAQSHLVLDAAGRVSEVRQPMLGAKLKTVLTDRSTAMNYDAYRMFPSIMKKSPYRIEKAALAGHIRYRFGFQDNAPFTLPVTGEQRVKDDGGVVTVDICGTCGPGLATDAATLADASKPTLWLQSDNAKIRAVADRVAGGTTDPAQKMALLAKETHRLLARTNFSGHYTALEALEHGSGDCTEEAALLAALGRAAGVPTRVASGLVYSREQYHGVSNTFMPHSWVLAYVSGRWTSFDAALEDFDSTHIALTIGDGDERSIAAASLLSGLLEWQAMAEVKSRPAP